MNVRTNHVHAVVSSTKKPEAVLSALKANATRAMREAELWTSELSPWEFRGSKKYLWDEKQLSDAIAYVECDQGEPLDLVSEPGAIVSEPGAVEMGSVTQSVIDRAARSRIAFQFAP